MKKNISVIKTPTEITGYEDGNEVIHASNREGHWEIDTFATPYNFDDLIKLEDILLLQVSVIREVRELEEEFNEFT